MPEVANFRSYLASAYALRGETQRKGRTDPHDLLAFKRAMPEKKYPASLRAPASSVAARFETTYFGGLRKAGPPEE